MEYENKEAKKFVQWFLLCSVIILLLTGTVTTLVVRNYRARENEAVTAMLGIVLKNDGSDTEESRQEKISECMRMLEHPHAYQKSHQKEIKEAEKILQSYGISEAEPVIAGTNHGTQDSFEDAWRCAAGGTCSRRSVFHLSETAES